MISASALYNLVACPHRVALDAFSDPAGRDRPNAFVELLWERGLYHEQEVIAGLTGAHLDLSAGTPEERAAKTLEAMDAKVPLIYHGRIVADELVGEPDLLRWEGNGYVAGDIKSGSAEEGSEGGKEPKPHYAVQVALYTDILERLGRSAGRRAFIVDRDMAEVLYDLDIPRGVREPTSLWEDYQEYLGEARDILSKAKSTRLALAGHCAQCHWNTKCQAEARKLDDLTLVPAVGRSKRDVLSTKFPTVMALAQADPEAYITGKKTDFGGIGPDALRSFVKRAHLLKNPDLGAYLKRTVELPRAEWEIFFDIEDDPFTGLCYLHGFLERRQGGDEESYMGFFIETPDAKAERALFARAVDYLRSRPDRVLYYYSPHERTIWRQLQKRFPEVAGESEIEAIFDPARSVDLLHRVVNPASEWPTHNYTIKSLATYLGFQWRDANPSGAASIEWFARWTESQDDAHKARLLRYNEDDCRATRVLLDGVRRLPVRS